MTRPAASSIAPVANPSPAAAPRLANGLALVAVACLMLITLASPGATRMFAWPWSLAYAAALLAPALALAFRTFDSRQPITFPPRSWLVLATGAAVIVLLSALASPYRGISLRWSAPLLAGIATFLLAFDGLNAERARIEAARERLLSVLVGLFTLIAVVSIGLWVMQVSHSQPSEVLDARNPYPLGHSNYTAGLALLMLPLTATTALRRPGSWRVIASLGAVLSLFMLFTSGSRGGLIGLGVMAAGAVLAAPFARRQKWQLAAAVLFAGLVFAVAHPRTRAMFTRSDPGAAPNISNVQRTAMLVAGWRMGTERPLLGWGPETTPLVYPRYRASLDGGVENVLQLHSLPAQIWAELGGAGIVCLLAFVALAAGAAPRHPVAAITLGAYAVFSFTDWQLDVPIFAGAVAVFVALLVPSSAQAAPSWTRPALGSLTLAGVAVVVLLGRSDPAPEFNSRALELARNPADTDQAAALFRESLTLNADQEIAHFNLGWLLVVRDPAAAEGHFASAAQLVPDKGGVYFGLGLARLNQGHRDDAARAFALECLNDPSFLTSPWWREPALAAIRDATATEFARLIGRARALVVTGSWSAAQLTRVAKLTPQLGRVPPGPEHAYRRERTGYPVLMRNLDLPTPVDLFDVREAAGKSSSRDATTLPSKGWLPSPLLLTLLNESASPKN